MPTNLIKSISTIFLVFFITSSFAQDKKQLRKDYNGSMKAFKKSEYSRGIELGTRALQGDLKKKQRVKLTESFRSNITRFHELKYNSINAYKQSLVVYQSDQVEKVETADLIVSHYSELINILGQVTNTPENILNELNFDAVIMNDYSADLLAAQQVYDAIKNSFVEAQYNMGEANLKIGTKEAAYVAYYNFVAVLKYEMDYKEATTKKKEARKAASYTISFSHVSNDLAGLTNTAHKETLEKCRASFSSGFNSLFGSHTFFKIVDSSADIVLSLQLTKNEYVVDNVNSDVDEMSKEIVVKEEKIKKENGEEEVIKVKETVKGVYTINSQNASSNLRGMLSIDNTLSEEEKQTIPVYGYAQDEIWWYTFRGDKRVLGKYEKANIVKAKPTFKSKYILLYLAADNIGTNSVDKALEELNNLFIN